MSDLPRQVKMGGKTYTIRELGDRHYSLLVPDVPHMQALDETIETVRHGLRALGYEATPAARFPVDTGWIDVVDRCIIFGPHALQATTFIPALRGQTIFYNLEQLNDARTKECAERWKHHTVWDYSQANVERLRAVGVNAVHVPIGYVPELTRIEPLPPDQEDIDVLFYGSLNARRSDVLGELEARGAKVKHLFGVYGKERDAWIARSKIVLNMHFYETGILETVRLSYLLANKRFVASEYGSEPDVDIRFMPGLMFALHQDMAKVCLRALDAPLLRTTIAKRGQLIMQSMPEAEILRHALAAPTAALLADMVARDGEKEP